jgi:hypothetical protein
MVALKGPIRLPIIGIKPGKTPLGLEEAYRDLRISPAEFDEVAFAAHKDEVTAGYAAPHLTAEKEPSLHPLP